MASSQYLFCSSAANHSCHTESKPRNLSSESFGDVCFSLVQHLRKVKPDQCRSINLPDGSAVTEKTLREVYFCSDMIDRHGPSMLEQVIQKIAHVNKLYKNKIQTIAEEWRNNNRDMVNYGGSDLSMDTLKQNGCEKYDDCILFDVLKHLSATTSTAKIPMKYTRRQRSTSVPGRQKPEVSTLDQETPHEDGSKVTTPQNPACVKHKLASAIGGLSSCICETESAPIVFNPPTVPKIAGESEDEHDISSSSMPIENADPESFARQPRAPTQDLPVPVAGPSNVGQQWPDVGSIPTFFPGGYHANTYFTGSNPPFDSSAIPVSFGYDPATYGQAPLPYNVVPYPMAPQHYMQGVAPGSPITNSMPYSYAPQQSVTNRYPTPSNTGPIASVANGPARHGQPPFHPSSAPARHGPNPKKTFTDDARRPESLARSGSNCKYATYASFSSQDASHGRQNDERPRRAEHIQNFSAQQYTFSDNGWSCQNSSESGQGPAFPKPVRYNGVDAAETYFQRNPQLPTVGASDIPVRAQGVYAPQHATATIGPPVASATKASSPNTKGQGTTFDGTREHQSAGARRPSSPSTVGPHFAMKHATQRKYANNAFERDMTRLYLRFRSDDVVDVVDDRVNHMPGFRQIQVKQVVKNNDRRGYDQAGLVRFVQFDNERNAHAAFDQLQKSSIEMAAHTASGRPSFHIEWAFLHSGRTGVRTTAASPGISSQSAHSATQPRIRRQKEDDTRGDDKATQPPRAAKETQSTAQCKKRSQDTASKGTTTTNLSKDSQLNHQAPAVDQHRKNVPAEQDPASPKKNMKAAVSEKNDKRDVPPGSEPTAKQKRGTSPKFLSHDGKGDDWATLSDENYSKTVDRSEDHLVPESTKVAETRWKAPEVSKSETTAAKPGQAVVVTDKSTDSENSALKLEESRTNHRSDKPWSESIGKERVKSKSPGVPRDLKEFPTLAEAYRAPTPKPKAKAIMPHKEQSAEKLGIEQARQPRPHAGNEKVEIRPNTSDEGTAPPASDQEAVHKDLPGSSKLVGKTQVKATSASSKQTSGKANDAIEAEHEAKAESKNDEARQDKGEDELNDVPPASVDLSTSKATEVTTSADHKEPAMDPRASRSTAPASKQGSRRKAKKNDKAGQGSSANSMKDDKTGNAQQEKASVSKTALKVENPGRDLEGSKAANTHESQPAIARPASKHVSGRKAKKDDKAGQVSDTRKKQDVKLESEQNETALASKVLPKPNDSSEALEVSKVTDTREGRPESPATTSTKLDISEPSTGGSATAKIASSPSAADVGPVSTHKKRQKPKPTPLPLIKATEKFSKAVTGQNPSDSASSQTPGQDAHLDSTPLESHTPKSKKKGKKTRNKNTDGANDVAAAEAEVTGPPTPYSAPYSLSATGAQMSERIADEAPGFQPFHIHGISQNSNESRTDRMQPGNSPSVEEQTKHLAVSSSSDDRIVLTTLAGGSTLDIYSPSELMTNEQQGHRLISVRSPTGTLHISPDSKTCFVDQSSGLPQSSAINKDELPDTSDKTEKVPDQETGNKNTDCQEEAGHEIKELQNLSKSFDDDHLTNTDSRPIQSDDRGSQGNVRDEESPQASITRHEAARSSSRDDASTQRDVTNEDAVITSDHGNLHSRESPRRYYDEKRNMDYLEIVIAADHAPISYVNEYVDQKGLAQLLDEEQIAQNSFSPSDVSNSHSREGSIPSSGGGCSEENSDGDSSCSQNVPTGIQEESSRGYSFDCQEMDLDTLATQYSSSTTSPQGSGKGVDSHKDSLNVQEGSSSQPKPPPTGTPVRTKPDAPSEGRSPPDPPYQTPRQYSFSAAKGSEDFPALGSSPSTSGKSPEIKKTERSYSVVAASGSSRGSRAKSQPGPSIAKKTTQRKASQPSTQGSWEVKGDQKLWGKK